LHGKLLVHEAVIAGVADILEEARPVGRERRLDQPAESSQAVIDRDHDDVVLGDHDRGVVDGAGAGDECTAMDPEEDRQARMLVGGGRDIDVEEEAILALRCGAAGLRACRPRNVGESRSRQ